MEGDLVSIYLAGPGCFFRDPAAEAARLKALCRTLGAAGLYPMDNEVAPGDGPAMARAIRLANEAMIRRCDAVIADMRPFRGPGMDGGTAYEIGFARALGKVVVGYTSDMRRYAERVDSGLREDDGTLRDPDGLSIEEFGLVDNLMMADGVDNLVGTEEEAVACAVALVRMQRHGSMT